ncbi:MAG: hypothetical protein H0W76_02480 [Pyrinomonadaceae bacterium]|nr:hypothetical protein [Pyrinomonadaceae bacterium]
MRIAAVLLGVVLAAAGGVIAYRALFVEPRVGVIVTESGVREFPNTLRVAGGVILLIGGGAIAFLASRRGRT